MSHKMSEMSNDTHVNELLPAYALGSLEQEESIQVSEHLATCVACRAELQSYQFVTDQLALAAPDVAPSVALRQRLTDRVNPAPAAPESQLSWWEQLTQLWLRAAPAWGMVSLALIVVLAVANLTLRQQVDDSRSGSSGMRVVIFDGTDMAPGATGTLVISENGEYGTLVVDGLPPLDAAHQYQLWLIKDGQRTNGGVFSVSSEGYGALEVSSPAPLASYPAFGVTIEPAGGSPGPTGDKVLGGSL